MQRVQRFKEVACIDDSSAAAERTYVVPDDESLPGLDEFVAGCQIQSATATDDDSDWLVVRKAYFSSPPAASSLDEAEKSLKRIKRKFIELSDRFDELDNEALSNASRGQHKGNARREFKYQLSRIPMEGMLSTGKWLWYVKQHEVGPLVKKLVRAMVGEEFSLLGFRCYAVSARKSGYLDHEPHTWVVALCFDDAWNRGIGEALERELKQLGIKPKVCKSHLHSYLGIRYKDWSGVSANLYHNNTLPPPRWLLRL
ncbi:unnamed protein product [Sympodiomycopsis kandeliae]